MEKYCKDNKIYSLKNMKCVDNTLNTRIVNNKVYSSNPFNYNKIKELKKIGKGEYGTVYKACFPNIKKQCRFTLVKKKEEMEVENDKELVDFVNKSPNNLAKVKEKFIEPYILYMSNKLLNNKVTQNLPYLYGYKIKEKYIEFVSEFANGGTFKNWVTKKRSKEEIENAYFQIFHGLYCINKYLGVAHNDLHWDNVLVFNVKKGGIFRYRIRGVDYYVPNLGYVFIIWDFGLARHMEDKTAGLVEDTYHISYVPQWIYEISGKFPYGKREYFDYFDKKIKKPEKIFFPFQRFRNKPQGKIIETFTS